MATPVDVEFRIPAPRESIFAFSGDLVALGNLVPGVASIEETGNPSQAVWHMQIKLGLMKVKRGIHEVLSFIMFNWIAFYLSNYVVNLQIIHKEGGGEATKDVASTARILFPQAGIS